MHLAQSFFALILFCAVATVGGFPSALLFRNEVNASTASAALIEDISTLATSTSASTSTAASKLNEFDIYGDLFYFLMSDGNFTVSQSNKVAECGAGGKTTTAATSEESLRGKRGIEDTIGFCKAMVEMSPEMVALLTGGGNQTTLIENLSHLYPRPGDDLAYTCTINSFSSSFNEDSKSVTICQEVSRLIASFEDACAAHKDSAVFQGVRSSLHFLNDLLCTNISSERCIALRDDLSECKDLLHESDGKMEEEINDKCAYDLSSEEAICKALFFCTVDEINATLDKKCPSRSPQIHADRHRFLRVEQFLFTMLASHGSVGKTCGSMIVP